MIIISGITFTEVKGDMSTFYELPPMSYLPTSDHGMLSAEKIRTELVRGRRFRRPSDGTDVVVGMTQDVQDLLGLQYGSWDALERETNNRLSEFKNASFIQRLKWLFTGYK